MRQWASGDVFNFFEDHKNLSLLCKSEHGLEKECLRVTSEGSLSQSFHPQELGSPLTHPYISTDFSEAQPEFITPCFGNEAEVCAFLEKLHLYTYRYLDEEWLWPLSAPCHILSDEAIPIADFGNSKKAKEKKIYRRGLALRYGRKMQALSGVHYNFSLNPALLKRLHKTFGRGSSFSDFRSDLYLRAIRNFVRWGWLTVYLFGACPALDRSFLEGYHPVFQTLDDSTLIAPYSTSIRTSRLGYHSADQKDFFVSYNSLKEYLEGVHHALYTPCSRFTKLGLYRKKQRVQLNDHYLQLPAELYSRVRPKGHIKNGLGAIEALEKQGICYLEVRSLDLNPFSPSGVSLEQLRFFHLFLLTCLFEESPPLSQEEMGLFLDNWEQVALYGRRPGLSLFSQREESVEMTYWAQEILEKIEPMAQLLDSATKSLEYTECLYSQKNCLDHPHHTPSAKLLHEFQESELSLLEWGIKKAQQFKDALHPSLLDKEQRVEWEQLAQDSLQEQLQMERQEQSSPS